MLSRIQMALVNQPVALTLRSLMIVKTMASAARAKAAINIGTLSSTASIWSMPPDIAASTFSALPLTVGL